MLCRCLGSWDWALHAGQAGLRSVSQGPASLSQREGSSPRAGSLFVHCTETCVGALVKNVNGAAPVSAWGWGSRSLVCAVGGLLAQSVCPAGAVLVPQAPPSAAALETSAGPRRKGLPCRCLGARRGNEVIIPGGFLFLGSSHLPRSRMLPRDEPRVLGVRALWMVRLPNTYLRCGSDSPRAGAALPAGNGWGRGLGSGAVSRVTAARKRRG